MSYLSKDNCYTHKIYPSKRLIGLLAHQQAKVLDHVHTRTNPKAITNTHVGMLALTHTSKSAATLIDGRGLKIMFVNTDDQ